MSEALPVPRILAADDDPDTREVLAAILSKDGAEVVGAVDGQDAVHKALLTQFDLCILDIEMPNMNGIEACARLRETPFTSHIPILFLTVHADRKSIERAFAAGASDYLCKPAHPLLLRRRVTNLLLLSRLARERDSLAEILKSTAKQ